MRTDKVTWTKEERDLLTAKAAAIYRIRGYGYGPSIIHAQNVWLEHNRRRPDCSINTVAIKEFKPGIDAILSKSMRGRRDVEAVSKLPATSVEASFLLNWSTSDAVSS